MKHYMVWMTENYKRFTALLLVLAMAVGFVPVTAVAEGEPSTGALTLTLYHTDSSATAEATVRLSSESLTADTITLNGVNCHPQAEDGSIRSISVVIPRAGSVAVSGLNEGIYTLEETFSDGTVMLVRVGDGEETAADGSAVALYLGEDTSVYLTNANTLTVEPAGTEAPVETEAPVVTETPVPTAEPVSENPTCEISFDFPQIAPMSYQYHIIDDDDQPLAIAPDAALVLHEGEPLNLNEFATEHLVAPAGYRYVGAYTLLKDEYRKVNVVYYGQDADGKYRLSFYSNSIDDRKENYYTMSDRTEPLTVENLYFRFVRTDTPSTATVTLDGASIALTGTLPEGGSVAVVSQPLESYPAPGESSAAPLLSNTASLRSKAAPARRSAASVDNDAAPKAQTILALDITITDAQGDEFQPAEGSTVAVTVQSDAIRAALEKGNALKVYHYAAPEAEPEEVEVLSAEGDTLTFAAPSFSVYTVVEYTVDFHWGEYTYNMEGGTTFFLSELLDIMIDGASGKEDTTELKKVRDNFDQIESVTFTNPELLAVDKVLILEGEPELVEDDFSEELIETLREDWRLVSLNPFTSDEQLTITLTDGSTVSIPVTDIIWGDDAGETVTPAGGSNALPRVTADGVTYIIRKAAGYADVYAISAGCTIHDYINYQGTAYPTNDIDQGAGRLTRTKNFMDLELVLRAAEHTITLPPVLTEPENDPAAEGFLPGVNNTHEEDGEVKPSTYQVWKKAEYKPETNSIEYTMKYFQAMKKKVPLDFIFIYDDSASMYSGVRYTGTPAVRMSETQVTRVMLLDAVNALLNGNTMNNGEDYDFRVYLGGTSTGDRRNSLATHPEGFTSYDDVADYLATFNTGVTDYTVGFENAVAMARASVNKGRTPVVVWLSDFHQGLQGSELRRTGDYALADQLHSLARVYGLSTGYRWPNLKVRTVCTSKDTVFNIRAEGGLGEGVLQLQDLIWHAIGYYMDKQVTVTDNLSDALKSNAVPAGTTDGGTAAAGTGKSVWTLGGPSYDSEDNVYYPQKAGNIYTETFSVSLDDNTVYAGVMPTNENATVYVGGQKENEITDSPQMGKGITFVLGELDEKDQRLEDTDKTPTNKVNGITFTLTEADENGEPKAGAETYTYTTSTVDGVDGVFTIPYKVGEGDAAKVVLELGKNYVLQEDESSVTTYNDTNASTANDLKAPDKSWLIKVADNGVVTTAVNGAAGQTPEITVAPAGNGKGPRLVIWNQIVVDARLIPITVQKDWPDDAPHKDPVPFTIYGVAADGTKHELPAYDSIDSDSASRVKYIEGDASEETWLTTVYVPDKIIDDNGNDIKFYDSEIKREAQLPSDRDYYVDGVKYETPAALIAAKGVDVDGSGVKVIEYNQSYRYAIEEGHMIYVDGWYSPAYSNNATATEANATIPGTDFVAKTKGIDGGSSWEPYTGETSTDMYVSLDVYTFSYRGDGLSDFENFFGDDYHISGHSEYQNFFNKLDWLEYTIVDNVTGTRYKIKSYVSGTYNMKDNLTHGVVLFSGIKVPKAWVTDRTTYPFSAGKYQISGSGTKLTIEQITCGFKKNGQAYSFTLYGGGVTHSMPWGPSHDPNHWNTALVPLTGADSHSYNDEHTFSTIKTSPEQELQYWHVVSTQPPQDDPTNSFSTKSCILPIGNTWMANPLIPTTVTKSWVNADGGSVPSNVIDLNKPIEFTIYGTTAQGTKALPLFDSASWTTTDPGTKGEITGESSASTWTKKVFVPTYDVLATYDPDTRTCTQYADFTADSITEDTTLIATIDGEELGEWTSQVTDFEPYSTTEIPGGRTETWDPVAENYVNRLYIKPHTTIANVETIEIKYDYSNGKEHWLVLNLDKKMTLSTKPSGEDSRGASMLGNEPYCFRFLGFQTLYNASLIKINEIKINGIDYTGTYTISPKSNYQMQAGQFYICSVKSENNYPRNYFTIKESNVTINERNSEELPAQTIVTPASFTLTNTFRPNVPVTLSSTFTDTTDDHASTGMIGSVVYTVEGTTAQGAAYSREVVATAGTPTTAEGSTSLTASTGVFYVPKGDYTITQTAYTLDGSARYATTAYTTTYGSPATDGSAQSVTLSSTALTNSFSFANNRKSLPIVVQTQFDPALTDADIASVNTRPMKDRTLRYALSYTTGSGTAAKLPTNESDPNYASYALSDSKFDTDLRNYKNEHSDGKVPTYSVFAVLTECSIDPANSAAALPDYSTYVDSEEKGGKLVFTIVAAINRAPVIVSKSWDEDIPEADRKNVTLHFSIRRSDGKDVYGTTQPKVDLEVVTDANGEAVGTFELGVDAEQTVIYLPAIRSNEPGVKYILTETGPENYYVNFSDINNEASNQFEQTRPGGKSGVAGDSTTNEAKFVLNQGGIMIDVNNAKNPYICKIVETFGTTEVEVPFRTLNKAVNHARTYGNGADMSATNPVKIEMLVDYVIPSTDNVTLDKDSDNIIITTAATSGGIYNFTPTFTTAQGRTSEDSDSVAILQRGWSGDQLFYLNSSAKLRTTDITLDGTWKNDSGYTGRAVYVNSGSLTVAGGSTVRNFYTADYGGAVYTNKMPVILTANAGGTILFDNCKSTKEGGAIETAKGKVTINNAGTIKANNCTGTYSGWICTDTGGELEINNSGVIEVTSCRATSNGGGAIWTGIFKAENNSGSISFTDCSAAQGGGAIYANRDAASTDTFVLTNTAAGTASFNNCSSTSNWAGGAIRVKSGNVKITSENTNSPITFENCTTGDGGGAIYQAGGNTMTLTNVTFGKDGDATKACTGTSGGAVYTAATSTVTLTNVKAYGKGSSENTATSGSGGAIYVSSAALTVSGGEFKDLKASSNGGAIYAGGAVTINGSADTSFTSCTAGGSGGAIYAGGAVTINGTADTSFTSCTAGGSGGAIYAGGAVSITGTASTSFTSCTATGASSNGGAIYAGKDVTIEGTATTFTACSAAGSSSSSKLGGGAIYQAGGTSMTLTNATFGESGAEDKGCSATGEYGYGGAIYTVADTATLTDCSFYYDETTGIRSRGGALHYSKTDGSLLLYGCVFDHCAASSTENEKGVGNGGAVYFEAGSTLTVDQSTARRSSFTDCTANRYGGAIQYEPDSTGILTVKNTDFVNCVSNTKQGGAIGTDSDTAIENCTFTNCSASLEGGAIMGGMDSTAPTIMLTNTTITSCSAKSGGAVYSKGDLTIKQTGTGTSSITGCSASDANGGAVNVVTLTSNSNKKVTFEGDVVIYGNPNSNDDTQQKNVVLDENRNTKIYTSGSGLGIGAHIGVYVTDTNNAYTNHGKWSQPFGTAATPYSEANLEGFTNDRDPALFGVNAQDMGKSDNTDKLIYWGRYICKIEDQNASGGKQKEAGKPFEHGFVTLNKALTYARNSFNNGNTMSTTNPAAIQMLVDYEIPASDKVSLTDANDNIIITTAPTSGGVYNFAPTFGETEGRTTQYEADGKTYKSGDSAETAILSRKSDFNNDSLFQDYHASAKLTTTNIIFDGRGISTAASGGIVHVEIGNLNAGSNTTMRNSVVNGNGNSYGETGNGGAIFLSANGASAVENGLLIDGDSTLTLAKAGDPKSGGGTMTAEDADAYNKNQAKTQASINAVNGGGIYVSSGASFTFTGGELTKCKASNNGGAIYNGGSLVMDENAESGDVHNLLNGSLEYCSAANGGAIYNAAGGTVDMAGSYIEHCIASEKGGGIYSESEARQTISGQNKGAVNLHTETKKPGVISDCEAANGGGIYLAAGELDMTGGTIEGCTAERKTTDSVITDTSTTYETTCASGNGGGVYNLGTVILATASDHPGRVKNCSADFAGGGIYTTGNGSMSITGGEMDDNRAGYYGGAIYDDTMRENSTSADLTIQGVVIRGHVKLDNATPNARRGGAIYAANGDLVLEDNGDVHTQIYDCTVSEQGGAIYHIFNQHKHKNRTAGRTTSLTLTNAIIDGHDQLTDTTPNAQYGGAIYVYNGCNDAALGHSGHNTNNYDPIKLSQYPGPNIIVSGGKILDCTADVNGGAIYCDSPVEGDGKNTISLKDGAVINGHESLSGDVWNANGKSSGNQTNLGGGAIYFNRGTLKVGDKNGAQVQILNCTAKNYGGAIFGLPAGTAVDEDGEKYTAKLENCLIDGHAAGTTLADDKANALLGGGGVYMKMSTVTIEDSVLQNLRAPYGAAILGRTNDGGTQACKVTIKGSTIEHNTATAANGGAVNAMSGLAIKDAGFTPLTAAESNWAVCTFELEGNTVIYNNFGIDALASQQKNLVLTRHKSESPESEVGDTNAIIKTTAIGLGDDAHIGVYVTGADGMDGSAESEPYQLHGGYEDDFGTYGSSANLHKFTNDRNGMYGAICTLTTGNHTTAQGHNKSTNIIRWESYLCKLTDKDGKLLYMTTQGGYAGTRVVGNTTYYPAVYMTLTEAFNAMKDKAADGTSELKLYTAEGVEYPISSDIQLHMLRNYTQPGNDRVTYDTDRLATLTTAKVKAADNAGYSNGDVYVYSKGSAAGADNTNATITRGNDANASMITLDTGVKELTLTNVILDGAKGSYQPKVNGGIVNVKAGTLSVTTGAKLQNSKVSGTSLGGAVYVAPNATMNLDAGTISGNEVAAAGNGAGIYLPEGSTLNISGSPSFSENTKDETLSGATNGQKPYTKARQDIFVAGYGTAGSAATSLVVTGAITSGEGTIWVGAEESEHYEMLKQFAVFESETVKTTLQNNTTLESTMHVFRNAGVDSDTGCGADYLTGQEGDDINNLKCIYWTGGFDFVFRKIDSDGKPMNGATFTLYKSNAAGTDILVENGAKIAYQVTGPGGIKENATGKSANIPADEAMTIKYTADGGNTVSEKKVYGDGLVKFEKIPPATYFLVETAAPADKPGWTTVEPMYKLVLDGKGCFTIYVKGENDAWTEAPVKTFVADTAETTTYTVPTASTSGNDTINVFNIMNVPGNSRKVVLRKVSKPENGYLSLGGARFRIFRADLTEWTNGQENGNNYYESVNTGVYFVDSLPAGTYYLVETRVPDKANNANNKDYGTVGTVFTLKVTDTAATVEDTTGRATGTGDELIANFKTQVQYGTLGKTA